jgi:1,2-diacylglycerol 3-alpha-glucosyltransferase
VSPPRRGVRVSDTLANKYDTMQAMRIAMYTDSFYPSINGVSTAIVNLALTLAKAGHTIFIQAPRYEKETDLSFFPPQVQVHYVKSIDAQIYPDFRVGTGLPLSLRTIRAFRPDIIHVHTPLSIGIEGTLIAKALKIPTVHTFHTYFMDEDALRLLGVHNKHLVPLVKRGGWRFNTAFCNRFDAIITPAAAVAKDIKKHGVKKPVYVAPNILDERIYSLPSKPRKKLYKLIFVGRLSREKRVDLTLRALAKLYKLDPQYELILIGDGPERNKLFNLAVELGVAQAITWYGAIDHDRLIREHLYHLGDIFVVSSKFETQGLSTLEAMAHGLPVVAVRCATNQEVIGKGGLVVANSLYSERTVKAITKAVIQLGQNSDVPYSQLAYDQAQQFSPDKLLSTYENIYHKVLQSSLG